MGGPFHEPSCNLSTAKTSLLLSFLITPSLYSFSLSSPLSISLSPLRQLLSPPIPGEFLAPPPPARAGFAAPRSPLPPQRGGTHGEASKYV